MIEHWTLEWCSIAHDRVGVSLAWIHELLAVSFVKIFNTYKFTSNYFSSKVRGGTLHSHAVCGGLVFSTDLHSILAVLLPWQMKMDRCCGLTTTHVHTKHWKNKEQGTMDAVTDEWGGFTSCRAFLTRKFELPTAGVAMVFSAKVPNGIVPQVGRSKYHIIWSVGNTPQWLVSALLL